MNTDEENANLCLILGKPLFVGSCVTWMARWNLVDAINQITSCRQRVLQLVDSCPQPWQQERSRCSPRAWAPIACLAETMRNTIMYQYALDTAYEPQFGPNMMDYDDNVTYDQRALVLRKIAREKLDNVADLLRILEAHPAETVLHQGRTPEEETVFTLGPHLVPNLRRK